MELLSNEAWAAIGSRRPEPHELPPGENWASIGGLPDWGVVSSMASLKPRQTFRFENIPVGNASALCTLQQPKPHRQATSTTSILGRERYSETRCAAAAVRERAAHSPPPLGSMSWQPCRTRSSFLHEAACPPSLTRAISEHTVAAVGSGCRFPLAPRVDRQALLGREELVVGSRHAHTAL